MADHDSDALYAVQRLTWRVSDLSRELDRFRKDVERMLSHHDAELNRLSNAERIAAGVAAELERRGVSGEGVASELEQRGFSPAVALTWWQKLGGVLIGVVLVIDAVKGLIT